MNFLFLTLSFIVFLLIINTHNKLSIIKPKINIKGSWLMLIISKKIKDFEFLSIK